MKPSSTRTFRAGHHEIAVDFRPPITADEPETGQIVFKVGGAGRSQIVEIDPGIALDLADAITTAVTKAGARAERRRLAEAGKHLPEGLEPLTYAMDPTWPPHQRR